MRFDALTEQLLKAGVAPRHVRRYVRELNEHLDDLTAQQRAAGYNDEDARSRARARLGDDAELAHAMLARPGMKSWPARLPWLVFLILPPLVTLAAAMPLYALAFLLGNAATKANQAMLITTSVTAMTAINVLAAPLIAAALVAVATRQRLHLIWPVLGIALLILLTPEFHFQFGHPHHGNIQAGYDLAFPSQWPDMAKFWPLMASHLLALTPIAWLAAKYRCMT